MQFVRQHGRRRKGLIWLPSAPCSLALDLPTPGNTALNRYQETTAGFHTRTNRFCTLSRLNRLEGIQPGAGAAPPHRRQRGSDSLAAVPPSYRLASTEGSRRRGALLASLLSRIATSTQTAADEVPQPPPRSRNAAAHATSSTSQTTPNATSHKCCLASSTPTFAFFQPSQNQTRQP